MSRRARRTWSMLGALCAGLLLLAGSWSFSGLLTSVPLPSGNLIPNPSFEESSLAAVTQYGGELSRVQLSTAPNGSYVARETTSETRTGFGFGYNRAVSSTTAGTSYSASVSAAAATSSSVGRTFALVVREETAAGALVSERRETLALATSFRRIALNDTIQRSGDILQVHLFESGGSIPAGSAFYADAAVLTPASTPTSTPVSTESPVPSATATPAPTASPTATATPAPSPTPTPSGTNTGASLASCSTSPCTSGSFSHTFTTCPATPAVLTGTAQNVISVGAVNNGVALENYCYAWYKPANINSTPAATVIVFSHCSGSNCAGVVSGYGWKWLADHNAFNVVFLYTPFDRAGGALTHPLIDYPAPTTAQPSDDNGVAAVVNDLVHGLGATKMHVDPARIYATGASSGGTEMIDLACTPDQNLFRGVAIVSAHVQLAESSTVNGVEVPGTERCPTPVTHPFFVMSEHGTADGAVPFNGVCNFGANNHCVASDTENRRFLAQHQGCSATPADTNFGTPSAANIRHSYGNCTHGLTPAYVSLTVTNGQHTDCALNDASQVPSPSICGRAATLPSTNGFWTAGQAWAFWASSRW